MLLEYCSAGRRFVSREEMVPGRGATWLAEMAGAAAVAAPLVVDRPVPIRRRAAAATGRHGRQGASAASAHSTLDAALRRCFVGVSPDHDVFRRPWRCGCRRPWTSKHWCDSVVEPRGRSPIVPQHTGAQGPSELQRPRHAAQVCFGWSTKQVPHLRAH